MKKKKITDLITLQKEKLSKRVTSSPLIKVVFLSLISITPSCCKAHLMSKSVRDY